MPGSPKRRRILVVIGTRPEAIKLAPLVAELRRRPHQFETLVCVTGQHRTMVDRVLAFFAIDVDYDLNVMETDQTLCATTARVLARIEPVVETTNPDLVVVQGDTNSALAGALAGFYSRTTVCHVEAGLRTGDFSSPYPEEMNRVLISRLSRFHFAPSQRSARTLLAEGYDTESVSIVGNTVVDALLTVLPFAVDGPNIGAAKVVDWSQRVVLVTGHRRESFGVELRSICAALVTLARRNRDVWFVYPVHLNPNVHRPVHAALRNEPNVVLLEPLDYPEFIWCLAHCYIVMTDSGGVQEEAPSFGKPVLVMRDTTERPEGIAAGTARLVGTDPTSIEAAVQQLLDHSEHYAAMTPAVNPYGDGTASAQIADILADA
jgi:UDP-N-acetylglucosamine 2-epimerase (non-hydrolysing)